MQDLDFFKKTESLSYFIAFDFTDAVKTLVRCCPHSKALPKVTIRMSAEFLNVVLTFFCPPLLVRRRSSSCYIKKLELWLSSKKTTTDAKLFVGLATS